MKKALMALPVAAVLALPGAPVVWFYFVYVRGVAA